MKKKNIVAGIIFVTICVLGIIAMIFRSEQLDTKKELPVTTQSNSANF